MHISLAFEESVGTEVLYQSLLEVDSFYSFLPKTHDDQRIKELQGT